MATHYIKVQLNVAANKIISALVIIGLEAGVYGLVLFSVIVFVVVGRIVNSLGLLQICNNILLLSMHCCAYLTI